MVKLKSQIMFLTLVSMIAVSSLETAPAAGTAGRRPVDSRGGKKEIGRDAERRQKIRELLKNDGNLSEISRLTKLSKRDVVDFFEREAEVGRLEGEALGGWRVLLGTMVTARTSATIAWEFASAELIADSVGSFMRLRKAGMQEAFHINERSLLDVQSTWTFEQRSNFSRVLERAADIAEKSVKENRPLTNEEAFEKALDELGYLEKYRKGCQR
ncbi:MAG: hypothetical protein AABZ06_13725 [Bdellovibrionota bacterium]